MSPTKVTFLFCAESGHFEGQTLLALESLREFGGALAQSPVLIVTPRFGPPLARKTLRRFNELGATYERHRFGHPFDWYPYTNKALAVLMAERHARTEQVIWLDSDVLVVAEPQRLVLSDHEDLAICAYDKNVGTTGPDDPNEPYWKALGEYYGIPVDRLPWVETEFDHLRVRFRLHSGVYSFRRGRRLGETFVSDLEKMFLSRIAFSRRLPFPGDDVALAFAVVRCGLRFRTLPMSDNFEIGVKSRSYRRDQLKSAKILHYHHALSTPDELGWMMTELEQGLPQVADWLRRRMPLERRAGGLSALLLRRALKEWRALKGERFRSTCRPAVQD